MSKGYLTIYRSYPFYFYLIVKKLPDSQDRTSLKSNQIWLHFRGTCLWVQEKLIRPSFFMPRHQKVAGYYVIPSEILSVRPSVCLSVCLSVRPSVRPSAPTTILVSATPPTVLGQSFWNFTGVLRMVWRYAYCFFRILKLFFITFFPFLCPATRKWRGIMLYPPKFCVSVRLSVRPSVRPSAPTTILVSATPPTVLGQSFWNFTGVLRMVWRYAYCFFRILKLFFITFFPFLT